MKEKLLKLLSLSTSQNENEAFVSVKKANELIKRENTTWEEVFKEQEPEDKYDNTLHTQLNKEKEYSKSLEEEIKNINVLYKYMCSAIVVLLLYIIYF